MMQRDWSGATYSIPRWRIIELPISPRLVRALLGRRTLRDFEGDRANSTAVSDEDCGPGLVYDTSKSDSLCATTVCDFAAVWTEVADRHCGSADETTWMRVQMRGQRVCGGTLG